MLFKKQFKPSISLKRILFNTNNLKAFSTNYVFVGSTTTKGSTNQIDLSVVNFFNFQKNLADLNKIDSLSLKIKIIDNLFPIKGYSLEFPIKAFIKQLKKTTKSNNDNEPTESQESLAEEEQDTLLTKVTQQDVSNDELQKMIKELETINKANDNLVIENLNDLYLKLGRAYDSIRFEKRAFHYFKRYYDNHKSESDEQESVFGYLNKYFNFSELYNTDYKFLKKTQEEINNDLLFLMKIINHRLLVTKEGIDSRFLNVFDNVLTNSSFKDFAISKLFKDWLNSLLLIKEGNLEEANSALESLADDLSKENKDYMRAFLKGVLYKIHINSYSIGDKGKSFEYLNKLEKNYKIFKGDSIITAYAHVNILVKMMLYTQQDNKEQMEAIKKRLNKIFIHPLFMKDREKLQKFLLHEFNFTFSELDLNNNKI